MSTDRFAFAGDHLTASFNAQSLGGRLESGYRFMTFYGGLTPYAAIQAQSFRTPSYSESDLTGGGFALAYNARTATDTRSELGARFDRLAWAHDWISDPTLAAVFQTLPGASFIVNGATPAKNSAPSFGSPTGSHLSANSTASLRPTRRPTRARARCDIRGECPLARGQRRRCPRYAG
jgi:outer membrane autotransporter protein